MMPNFRIRELRVDAFKPRISAALPWPQLSCSHLLFECPIRGRKLEQKGGDKPAARFNSQALLTNKETDDLFKIAFRNYNQLISVADSKASLLINVNSIIISVLLAFVVSKVEKNAYLLLPTSLLLLVRVTTILLSILASRSQMSRNLEDKHSTSYQRFFFGSFDLIDPGFRTVRWDQYYRELSDLFSTSRENVYLEVYKESYNVRKVLAQKFNYLSRAYRVFIVGLLVSILAFVICIAQQTASASLYTTSFAH